MRFFVSIFAFFLFFSFVAARVTVDVEVSTGPSRRVSSYDRSLIKAFAPFQEINEQSDFEVNAASGRPADSEFRFPIVLKQLGEASHSATITSISASQSINPLPRNSGIWFKITGTVSQRLLKADFVIVANLKALLPIKVLDLVVPPPAGVLPLGPGPFTTYIQIFTPAQLPQISVTLSAKIRDGNKNVIGSVGFDART
jgi:hypothetical protein